MLNKEKYVNELLNFAYKRESFGVAKNRKMVNCTGFQCTECIFNVEDAACCEEAREKWMNSEYVEPPVDWSKVPVDTPILVINPDTGHYLKRYFAEYKDGLVYAWKGGVTSWSVEDNTYCVGWGNAKLAEIESEEK